MKFKLKNYVIGFEVPFLGTWNEEDKVNLSTTLADNYEDWFTVLDCRLWQITLENTNQLILFNFIVLVDSNLINPDSEDGEWKRITSSIQTAVEKYLKDNNLTYRIINQ